MNEKSEKYYKYLKGKGVSVPPTYDSFVSTLKDDGKREKYYKYLQSQEGVSVAPDFDTFTSVLVGEEGQPANFTEGGEQPSQPSEQSTPTTTTSSSEEPSQQQERPVEKVDVFNQAKPFVPFVSEFAKQAVEEKKTLQELDTRITDLTKKMVGMSPTTSSEERERAAEERALLNERYDKIVNSQLESVENRKKKFEDSFDNTKKEFDSTKETLIAQGGLVQLEDGSVEALTPEAAEAYNSAAEKTSQAAEVYQTDLKTLADREAALLAKKGTFGGYLQNQVVEAETNYLSGVMEIFGKYMTQPILEAMGAPPATAEEIRKVAKESFEPMKKALQTEDTTPEFAQRVQEEDDVVAGVVGAVSTLPVMISPAMSGVFFQSYAAAGDEVEDLDLTEAEKETYRIVSSAIEYGLEKAGMVKVLSKNPVLKKALFGRIVPKLKKGVAGEQLDRLVSSEINQLKVTGVENFLGGVAAETATGGGQEAGNIILKETFNAYKAEEIFEEKDLAQYVEDILQAAKQEGIGAVVLSGTLNAANLFSNNQTAKITEQDLKAAQMLVEDPEKSIKLLEQHLAGKPEAYRRRAVNSAKELSEVLQKIPPNLRGNTKAIQLVKEKTALQQFIEGKDEDLTISERNRIKEIGAELQKLTTPQPQQDAQTKETQEGTVRDRTQEETPSQEEAEVGAEETVTTEEVEQEADVDRAEAFGGLTERLKTPRIARVGATFDKALQGEQINEEEINRAQEALLDELDAVEKSNAPQNIKDQVVAEIERAFNQLENYEFTTETKTRTVTKKTPIRVPRKSKREQTKTPQERTLNREVKLVEGTESTQDGFDPQDGNTVVLEEQDGKLVLQEFDKDGNRTTAQELEAESVNDFELVETVKDENGNVVGATLRNKNNDGEVFSIMDEELALDYAVEKTKAEVGELTFAEEQLLEEYEQLKPRKDAIQEQETKGVDVRQQAEAGQEVEQEVREQAKEEVQDQEEVAKAKENLSKAWEEWKSKQRSTGIAFDPKSKAEEDVKLVKAIAEYVRAVAAKTVADVKRAVRDFTGGEIEIDDAGAAYILNQANKPSEEAKARAKRFGFNTPVEARNRVNQRLGKNHERIEDIPDSELEQVQQEKAAEDIFTTKDKSKISTFFSRWRRALFSARRFLPRSVFKFKEQKDAAIAKNLNTMEQNVVDFNRALSKYKGDKTKLVKDFDAFIRGEEVLLPDEFVIIGNTLRNHIDALSLQLINGGYVTETQAETIRENIGTYMTRAFKVYDDTNWKNKVQEEIKQKARNFLRIQLRPQAEAYAEQNQGADVEELLDTLVDREMDSLLDKEGANNFLTGGRLGSKDLSVLKQRQDIPFEIRALMGEYSDPIQNYARTIQKMAALFSNAKFLSEVKEKGMGIFLFEENDPTRPSDHNTQIAPEGSDVMNPLNGLYTTKEIAEEFNDMGNTKPLEGWFWRNYMKGISTVKWVKTIGSFTTHIKNLLGNGGFMFMNGHWRLSGVKDAFNTVRSDILKTSNKELRERMNRYIELGFVKQSAGLNELRDMFKDANLDDALKERLTSRKINAFQKMLRAGLRSKKFVEDLYQAEDDFFKIIAYENEASRYSKALFGKEKSELTEQERAEMDDVIVDIVKNTYPTYDRVPEAIQMIRRFPLVGNFVSFQAEAWRTMYNSINLAKEELSSDNTRIRKIGASRIVGAITYEVAKDAILGYFGMSAGVGLSGVFGAMFNDDEEEEKDKDVRAFVAPWSKKSDLLVFKAGEGELEYVDFSASDPHGGIRQVINSFTTAQDPLTAFQEAIVQTVEPFLGDEIMTKMVLGLKNNQNHYGTRVYNPEDTFDSKSKDILKFVYETFELGTVKTLRRLYEAENKGVEAVAAFLGFRAYDVDVADNFGYKAKEYRERLQDARALYSREFYNDKSTPEERLDAYVKADEAYRNIMGEVISDYNSAERLGVSGKVLQERLKDFRFNKIDRVSVALGKPIGYILSDNKLLQSLIDKSTELTEEQKQEYSKLIKEL